MSLFVPNPAAPALAEALAHDDLERMAQEVLATARGLVPVQTGALQASMTVESEGTGFRVSANTRYAGYVEYGTYKDPSQPYLRPALEAAG